MGDLGLDQVDQPRAHRTRRDQEALELAARGPPGQLVEQPRQVLADLWVRGICAVRPGVTGLSETIRVRSILGRFLEHSRIFTFGGGGEPIVYIGSADLMHRNLDRRVEALLQLSDPGHIESMQALMTMGMSEDVSSWHLGSDGGWTRHCQDAEGNDLTELQSALIESNARRRRKARRR